MAEAAPRLYLITPPLAEAASFAPELEAVLAAGDIACVLLRTASCAARAAEAVISPLARRAQGLGVAVLVDDPQLALHCEADGVHVSGPGAALNAALAAMKPDKIVGVGGLATRHEAMIAGESGADYVMFGAEAQAQSLAEIVERIGWWAQIFTVPCVAYAQTLGEVAPLAEAGADFIALCDAVWDDPQGAAAAVEAAMRALFFARETSL